MLESIKRIFVARTWKVIEEFAVLRNVDGKMIAKVFVLQDQFGNIKQKKVSL